MYDEILNDITSVFHEVLDDFDLVLSESDTADDVDDWDSLSHIMIVVGIEKKFNIKFLTSDISKWKNISDMIDSIESNL